MLHKKRRRNIGFTLVEVMIVLVIIAVLMIIGVYSYNDVMQQATITSIKGDLSNAYYALKNSRSDYGVYPTTIDCGQPESETNKCIRTSNGATIPAYQVRNVDPANFCISVAKSPYTFNIDKDQNVSRGKCPVFAVDAASKTSYPGSGNMVYDISGNSNDGTFSGGVAYSITDGGAFDFNGVDGRILFPKPSIFDFNQNSFSWGVWVKITTSAGLYDMPWHNGGASASTSGFTMNLGTGVWDAGVSDGSNQRDVIISNTEILGSWQYLFVVINRTDNTFKSYLNGQYTGFSTDISAVSNVVTHCASTMGASCHDLTNTYPFKGLIGSVRIYDVALTAAEILQNYNDQKVRYGL